MVEKGHYSDKGGHYLRGAYRACRESLEEAGIFARGVITLPPETTVWQQRRFMRRISESGKR